MTDDRDRGVAVVVVRRTLLQPGEEFVVLPLRPQRLDDLDTRDLERRRDDLGGLPCADERARCQHGDAGAHGAQSLGAPAHLRAAGFREWTLIIASTGGGKRFLVFGDGVADDEKIHGSAWAAKMQPTVSRR